jgi:heme exporter protein D
METVASWLAMGGYALFVWPAYAIAAAILGGLALHSWRRQRASAAVLDRAQAGRRE